MHACQPCCCRESAQTAQSTCCAAGSSAGLRLMLRTPAKRTVGRSRCCDCCVAGSLTGFCFDQGIPGCCCCHLPMPPTACCLSCCSGAARPGAGVPDASRGGIASKFSGGVSAAAGRAAYFCCSFLPGQTVQRVCWASSTSGNHTLLPQQSSGKGNMQVLFTNAPCWLLLTSAVARPHQSQGAPEGRAD
jgi:hypothetical protein